MKRIIIFILTGTLLLCTLAVQPGTSSDGGTDDILRLHIRAANDSEEEQALKLSVRNAVLRFLAPLTAECRSKEEAKNVISAHLTDLRSVAEETIQSNGKDHTVTAALTREFFDYREYNGFFLPEGEYDALRIDIGAAEGHNWWCVIFPAACYVGAAEKVETNAEKMPQRFRLANKRQDDIKVEWWLLRRLRQWFSGKNQ